jgi:hypothetical protein
VISLIRPAADPALSHHNEAGEKDGFNRHNHIKKWKRYRIKMANVAYLRHVDHNPACEPHRVNGDEDQAAYKCAEEVSDPLGGRAPGQKLRFMLQDNINVFLQVACLWSHTLMDAPNGSLGIGRPPSRPLAFSPNVHHIE